MQNSAVNKTVLDNGLTIVTEHNSVFRSVALGIWIKMGSRFETLEEKGMAHFIEHMLFKGTKNRTALEIASSLEELGGSLNAFTGKEETCFYIHTLDSHLKISVQVLADMICNSLFRESDIEMEKHVVLEEIKAVKDTPDEYIFDIFQEKIFPDQPLGYPILGNPENVRGFDRQKLIAFWKKHYHPSNIVVSASGNISHDSLVELVKFYFNFPDNADRIEMLPAKVAQNIHFKLSEPLNQTHICLGNGTISYYDENRFDLIALNTYLGGGLSSRLFQVLREQHGLVYTVYSFLDFYKDTGVIGFYLGTDVKNQEKAIGELHKELDQIATNKLTLKKVNILKEQIKGSFFLSMESTFKRMSRLAKNEIYFNKFISADELAHSINQISPESINKMANEYLNVTNLNSVIMSSGKN
ncbi:MAG: insulinase family protein [Calditrichaeota bacterium]|nr:MAG: insulinase family protein [Calditrichota bacterium]MBL1203908.1 insulinase family protein [Calditrichota bacterium]NOG43741.1 insulinase family protein [Calditrichota bacterium]